MNGRMGGGRAQNRREATLDSNHTIGAPSFSPYRAAFAVSPRHPLLAPPELLQIFPLSLPLTFGIVSRSDLQACNLRALTGPQWPKNRVSTGSRSVTYKSFRINA
jgi:hypothetical protein